MDVQLQSDDSGVPTIPPPSPALLHQALTMARPEDLEKALHTVQAMAEGERPELLQMISENMGITPQQLKAMAGGIAVQAEIAMQSSRQLNCHAEDIELRKGEEIRYKVMSRIGKLKYYADVAWPTCYMCLVSLLFQYDVLPFWPALFLVPALFVLGVHFVVVKGAGIPHAVVAFSRLPCVMVAGLEVIAIGTFAKAMFPMLYDFPAQCGLLFILAALALYFHIRAALSDPGEVPPGNSPPHLLTPAEILELQGQNPAWCYTCNTYRPIRSKHCQYCDKCRPEFDHHCPAIGSCVAVYNRRLFVGYITLLLSAELVWMSLAGTYYRRIVGSMLRVPSVSTLTAFSHFNALARTMPGTVFMTMILYLFIFPTTLFLVGRQCFIIAGNMTVNEFLLRNKYAYFKDTSGIFWNPFDMGLLSNCVVFWQTERPDWYSRYDKNKDGPSTATGIPIITRFLRKWDRSRIALTNARKERKIRAEEALLRAGGGVSEEVLQRLRSQPAEDV